MSDIWLAKRKRRCLICGSKVEYFDRVLNTTWNYYKQWFKCPKCSFLQSSLTEDLYRWLINGKGGTGGIYELGYRQYRLARILLDDLGLKRIIIHGAGYNNALELLLEDKYDVYGCDLVNDVIVVEKKLLGKDRYFHINDYPEEKFDGMVSVEVFEHLINPLEETKEILSHLNDKGVLCISTDFFPVDGKMEDRKGYGLARSHVSYWSEKSMKRLAKECGYDIHIIKMQLPPSTPDDPPSMEYDYSKQYPNRLIAFIYKDEEIGKKIKSLPDIINIQTHNTERGIAIDYED